MLNILNIYETQLEVCVFQSLPQSPPGIYTNAIRTTIIHEAIAPSGIMEINY